MSLPDKHELQPNNSVDQSSLRTLDATSIFLDQIQQERNTQTAAPPGDRDPDRDRDVSRLTEHILSSVKPDQTAVYPNLLIAEAQSAGNEIAGYLASDHNPSEVIRYNDAQGQSHETTIGDRVEMLRTLINQNCQNAIIASNELIKQNPNLDKELQNATANLQTAAQQMALDYDHPNFRQTIQNNPYYKQLSDIADQQAMLQSARMATGTAMLTYAMLKAEGLTENPSASMEAFRTTGKPKPTLQELNDAFILVSQAGRTNSEIFNSPLYARVNIAVKDQYAQTQAEKGNQIITILKEADQLSQSGDAAKAEAKYKEAWQLGERIDQKFLAAQLKLKDNRTDPQVAQALVGFFDVEEDRMHYANSLVKQGKYEDALPIVLSVGADTPEFAQADPTYNKLVSDATFGKSIPQGELQAHQVKFAQLMQDTNNPNRFTDAQHELDTLVKNFQDTKVTLDKSRMRLESTRNDLDTKLQGLDKNRDQLDPEEYKIEKQRLQAEMDIIDCNLKENEKFAKQEPYLKYLQGVLAYSRDDKDTAHVLFQEVKKTDPDLAKNPALNLDNLVEGTKHQNWFQRNWHAIATVSAVASGIAVGIVVGLVTGPGGIAAGISTTSSILLAIGGGAVTGGAAYSSVKGAALGFDKVRLTDFKDGAFLGGLSASAVVGGPLLGAIRAAAAPQATVAAGEAATAIEGGTWLGRAGQSLASCGRSVAVGSGIASVREGYQVTLCGKSWRDATASFAWEAPVFSLGTGMAAARGLTLSTIGWSARTLAIGSAAAVAKESLDMSIDHKSFHDAAKSFLTEAPLYASTFGIAGNAAFGAATPPAALAQSALRTFVIQQTPGLVELGKGTYQQIAEHTLDPNNASDGNEIWRRYGQLNPSLYRPEGNADIVEVVLPNHDQPRVV